MKFGPRAWASFSNCGCLSQSMRLLDLAPNGAVSSAKRSTTLSTRAPVEHGRAYSSYLQPRSDANPGRPAPMPSTNDQQRRKQSTGDYQNGKTITSDRYGNPLLRAARNTGAHPYYHLLPLSQSTTRAGQKGEHNKDDAMTPQQLCFLRA